MKTTNKSASAMLPNNLPSVIFNRGQSGLWGALLVGAFLLLSSPAATSQNTLSNRLEVPAQGASGVAPLTMGNRAQPVPQLAAGTAPSKTGLANPFGLSSLWQQGDWVARGCLLLLGLMSLASWYALLVRLLALRRLNMQTRNAAHVFNDIRQFASHMALLTPDNPVRHVADAGSVAVHQYAALKPRVDYDTWLVRAIEQALSTVQMRLQGGMALLATIGSTAPFVGLFGTVWAIYTALVNIGASPPVSIDRVAGPVGEALIMTALGLAVAVPAVFGYNWLLGQNKLAFESVRSFGTQLHSLLLATTDLTAPGAPQTGTAPSPPDTHAESEFNSGAGSLNSHLSSPDATPDIRL